MNREKCAKMGVSVASVFSTIQTFLGSNYVNDFTIFGRDFHVVAQADTDYRSSIYDISKYYVKNSQGQMIPLSTVTDFNVTESAPIISHYNLFRSAEINGSAAPGYSSGEAIQAMRDVADKVLPSGYGYEFSGLSREEIKCRKHHLCNFRIVNIIRISVSVCALRKLVSSVCGIVCHSHSRIRCYSGADLSAAS